ncbi:MAG TPA: endopeptidase La, partial [Gemmatimonadaceae bacterium]|nr:endopeptidase La [Gemmatimonadaceae bacterium]
MSANRLPVLPLRDVVIYPYTVMPLIVGRAGSLAAVEAAMSAQGALFLVAQRNAEVEEPAAADLYRVGVVGRVIQVARQPNGTARILIEGISRVRVAKYARGGEVMRAVFDDPEETAEETMDVRPLARRAVADFEEYVALHRRIPPEVVSMILASESPERQAFGIAAHLAVRHEVRQSLLEAESLPELLNQLHEVIVAEIEVLRLERKLDEEVRGSLVQNQREFYLQEQLKAIHRELGEDDGADNSELEAQVQKRAMPDAVKARALRETRRLRRMSPLSPEAGVIRGYVEWILALPWSERTDDVVDIAHARRVLDEDHHGLEDVKDRILDYISVLSLVERQDGPILCLVGPPGVGKTSLGRSVARALGRKFVRMSLGGVRDEAEIRGHRRTYVGAMPGRIIQAMRRAEAVNPVVLLDEIDKLGQDYRGDPAAALLEVLDPEQNRAFNDHFLEVDYDLSQVLFITTANYLPQIPPALRDRMEVITLSGYLDQEKHAIARQFLIPKQLRANGLDAARVTWEPDVIGTIVRNYTREAGVRELERQIARVSRKLARRTAETPAARAGMVDLTVRAADLPALLGTAKYDPEALSLEAKVGVASGLAYTSMGGEVLEIEVSAIGGRGKLQLTGTLGDVMKESAGAALSYVRARAASLGIERDFYKTRDLHVHIPAGGTPKDGPSAGIAIATAIVSALTGIPVRGDVAMTGEVTLRGRVLPIGGLKEKAVAAHRNGIRVVLIPAENQRELDDIPPEVRAAVRFHPVRSMDEVLGVALQRPTSAQDEPVVSPATLT